MALDPDLVRIDLLRCKRKIYNSYPENSEERRQFLLVSKMSEIGYLSKIVPPDVVNLVFDEYHARMKEETIDIALNLGLAVLLMILSSIFHSLYHTNIIAYLWSILSVAFLANGVRHIKHLFFHWNGMKDFKKEHAMIKDQIKKLSDEMKRIGDGK